VLGSSVGAILREAVGGYRGYKDCVLAVRPQHRFGDAVVTGGFHALYLYRSNRL